MIGSGEAAVIAVLALLLFGPEKLPELARSVGKAYAEFKSAMEEAEREMSIARLEKINRDVEEELASATDGNNQKN